MTNEKSATKADLKHRGVRIVHAGELDTNTPQTPGMNRATGDQLRARRGREALGQISDDPP
jgi:hypothetical protein